MMKNKLGYTPKTSNDVNNLFIDSFVKISRELHLEYNERNILIDHLEHLKEDVKKLMQGEN